MITSNIKGFKYIANEVLDTIQPIKDAFLPSIDHADAFGELLNMTTGQLVCSLEEKSDIYFDMTPPIYIDGELPIQSPDVLYNIEFDINGEKAFIILFELT
ncbi:MAG: CheY-specific phosphatase CheX [Thermoproteota archaeon]|jgi:CheY-specific phosphatase CheX